ncbi:TRAP transporter permease [Alteribacter natronophilus]|uniref:TRAP transporter permease n=1 Tax=Alteribacter natronophilus TaxID=2583810 RepID=UPI00110D8F7B|nr:TRAP transporter permease [Alteribacter natronophilus]TMW72335.1 TRAP transporter permease [Alteribacter natronophilus]
MDNNKTPDNREAVKDPAEKSRALELQASDRMLKGFWALLFTVLALILSIYHFYTAGFGLQVGTRTHLLFHLMMGLTLVFILYPVKKGLGQTKVPWYDLLLSGLVLFVGIYIIQNQQSQAILSARPETFDIFISVALIALVLEATRRVVGKPLVIIAACFIAYYFLGEYMPGILRHTRTDFERFFYEMGYTTAGIFGTPLSVSATYVFIFILFGAILESTGAGKMFIDLALRAFGRFKGGPAKAAVVSSGMLGSISGSSTANAVTTGTFTIPLMKRVGFRPHTAGGIEVAASSSGQFLPPIMGAAAFLMIEYTGIAYVEIIRSALIPAILSYIAILLMVHFEASKYNISGLKKSELVSARRLLLQQGYLILPIFVLIYFLVQRFTVPNAAFFAIVVILVMAFFAHRFKERLGRSLVYAGILMAFAFSLQYIIVFLNQFTPRDIQWRDEIPVLVVISLVIAGLFAVGQKGLKIESAPVKYGMPQLVRGLELAARNSLSVIVATATAGILIGVVNLTGLSLKLSNMIISFSGTLADIIPAFLTFENTQLYFALILTVIACLILGLGLPTTATYVILAAMVAPALVDLGVPILAAHLFVLYYGVLADDTPPINLPAYATAGIANAEPVRTGVQGFKYDSGALLLPFAFATNPIILLLTDASWWVVGVNIFTALVGIIAFASVIQGWFVLKYYWFERWSALIAALVLINHHWISDLIGIGIVTVLFTSQFIRGRKEKASGSKTVEVQG